jgi:hypothetical protein
MQLEAGLPPKAFFKQLGNENVKIWHSESIYAKYDMGRENHTPSHDCLRNPYRNF